MRRASRRPRQGKAQGQARTQNFGMGGANSKSTGSTSKLKASFAEESKAALAFGRKMTKKERKAFKGQVRKNAPTRIGFLTIRVDSGAYWKVARGGITTITEFFFLIFQKNIFFISLEI